MNYYTVRTMQIGTDGRSLDTGKAVKIGNEELENMKKDYLDLVLTKNTREVLNKLNESTGKNVEVTTKPKKKDAGSSR